MSESWSWAQAESMGHVYTLPLPREGLEAGCSCGWRAGCPQSSTGEAELFWGEHAAAVVREATGRARATAIATTRSAHQISLQPVYLDQRLQIDVICLGCEKALATAGEFDLPGLLAIIVAHDHGVSPTGSAPSAGR